MCRCRAVFFFCCWSRSCSSSQIWRWESPSPPSPKTSCKRYRYFLRLSPVDFALRIHVSVSRHATLGPNGRRSFSSHPFSAHRPRHPLKREWHRRYHASALADRALCPHRFGHRNKTLPADAGLKGNGKELRVRLFVIGANGRTGQEIEISSFVIDTRE